MAKDDFFDLTIVGGPELADACIELGKFTSPATAKNAIKRGMIAALQPMVVDAKAKAPKHYRDLENAITASDKLSAREKRAAKANNPDSVFVYFGVTTGQGPTATQQEFGTRDRHQQKTGRETGHVNPRPFLRPSFEGNAQKAIDGMIPSIWQELAKAAARVRKKADAGKLKPRRR